MGSIKETPIRHADDSDCPTIVSFVRATLQDLESVGRDQLNHDKIFWKMYGKIIVKLIRKDDRLYLLAHSERSIVWFLEGKNVFQYQLRMRFSS